MRKSGSLCALLAPKPALDVVLRLGRLVLNLPVQPVHAGAHLSRRLVPDLVDLVEAVVRSVADHAVRAGLVAGIFNLNRKC